jgi:UDP-xylose/UDP-N-acetylglucosamine transporter B4
MLTGYFIGRKRYSAGQIVAGAVITAGIVLATIAAPRPPRTSPSNDKFTTQVSGFSGPAWLPENVQYAAGIGLLSLALFLSAWLGLWQEKTYKVYGKQWREALFYSVSKETDNYQQPDTDILPSTPCPSRSSSQCTHPSRGHSAPTAPPRP